MAEEGPFGPPDQIPDWKDILGEDSGELKRVYVVPTDDEAIRYMVAQAVFSSLTNQDLIQKATEGLSVDTHDEKEEMAIRQMVMEDYLRREGEKFQAERSEALRQADLALEKIKGNQSWMVDYDYWHETKIGVGLRATRPEDDSDYVLLEAPVEEIGEEVGFPADLTYMEEEEKGAEIDEKYKVLLDGLESLGFDRSKADERIRASAIEGTDICSFVKDLEDSGQKARMVVEVTINNATVTHKPESDEKEADLSTIDWLNTAIRVSPEITPDTRHDKLLGIKRSADDSLSRAGFLKPNQS